jgi:hypothetical protein
MVVPQQADVPQSSRPKSLERQRFGSTLKLTLGCFLSEQLGIELRRVGRSERLTFAHGEAALSAWMYENAFVCWTVCEQL